MSDLQGKLDLIEEHNERIRRELGDTPIVLARNAKEHADWCRKNRRSIRGTASADLRSLEGLRPTSIVHLPEWWVRDDVVEISERVAILKVKAGPGAVLDHYVMGGNFLATDLA